MALENESNRDENGDFLDSLILEIDELLEQDGELNNFQNKFDDFCFVVESYGTEFDKFRQLANNRFENFANNDLEAQKLLKDYDKLLLREQIERYSEVSLLYIRQCQTPPIDNPTWVSHGLMGSGYIANDDSLSNPPLVYRPPLLDLPPNPLFWFFSEMGKYLSDSDPIKQPNETELLMCDFARLAVIHDESCDYNKSTMIYKNKKYNGNFKRDDFTKDLWETYKNPKEDNFKKTHKRILRQALNHVKSNLVQPKTNIDFNNNFIKATIKHLPYFGPYLFDLIYGVDGVKTHKKENESKVLQAGRGIAIPEPDKGNKASYSVEDIKVSKPEKKKPWCKKVWIWIIGLLSFLGLLTTVIIQSTNILSGPELEICFALTGSQEISIVGNTKKPIDLLNLGLIYRNNGNKTAHDAKLRLIYSDDLRISSSNEFSKQDFLSDSTRKRTIIKTSAK